MFVTVVVIAAPVQATEPSELTREEAESYIRYAPIDEVVDDIIALDRLERSVPDVDVPRAVVVTHGDDVSVVWPGPVSVTIDGRLKYLIELPEVRAEGIVPRPPSRWPLHIAGAVGVAAAGAVGSLAGAAGADVMYGAAVGIAAGALSYLAVMIVLD